MSSHLGARKSNPGSLEDPKDREAVTTPHVICPKSPHRRLSRKQYLDSSCPSAFSPESTFPLCCALPYLGHHQLWMGNKGLGAFSTCLQVGEQMTPVPSLQLHPPTFKLLEMFSFMYMRFSCLYVRVPSARSASWGQTILWDWSQRL